MPQAEPRADADRTLAGRDKPPCHKVNGADVVRVKGMAETKRVRQDSGGNQRWEEAKHNADGCPDDYVDGDEEADLPHDGRRQAPEDLRDRKAGGREEAGHCPRPGANRECPAAVSKGGSNDKTQTTTPELYVCLNRGRASGRSMIFVHGKFLFPVNSGSTVKFWWPNSK